jgi:hypothetical protein
MDKQKIKVNYRDSGVKTLKGLGIFFFAIGAIALLSTVIGCLIRWWNDDTIDMILVSMLASASVVSLFFAAACIGLSNIAKTALYKRTLLEQEYEFKDVTPNINWLLE